MKPSMIWLSVKTFFSLRWRALMPGVSATAGSSNAALSARQLSSAVTPGLRSRFIGNASIAT
jgi:hypothetical protein